MTDVIKDNAILGLQNLIKTNGDVIHIGKEHAKIILELLKSKPLIRSKNMREFEQLNREADAYLQLSKKYDELEESYALSLSENKRLEEKCMKLTEESMRIADLYLSIVKKLN